MKIFIHIGRHKTGTTTLQKILSNKENELLKSGILYPTVGRDPEKGFHHRVFAGLLRDDWGQVNKQINKIFDEAIKAKVDTVLLSSEILSRSGWSVDRLKTLRNLFGSDVEVKIVVYLRPQDDFLLSTYAERVKRGLLKFPQTIHDIEAQLDYEAFLNKYEHAFGINAIIVRNYEEAKQKGIFYDLAAVLSAPQMPLPAPSWDNKRLPWLYIWLLRYANRWEVLRNLILWSPVSSLFGALGSLVDFPSPLSQSHRQAILKLYTQLSV